MWFKPENLTERVLEFTFQHDSYEIWRTNAGTFVAYSRPSEYGIWQVESEEHATIAEVVAEVLTYYTE